jgi:hypothetical protein
MVSKYYRRGWDESRGDAWDSWGRCVYLFEVGADGRAMRQVEQYEGGPTLRYGEGHEEDEHGFLTSEPFPLAEWAQFEVSGETFAEAWTERA